MFQKKDLVFSESLGVCVVQKLVRLSADKTDGEGTLYYVLRTVTGEEKTSYIPVEHHQMRLRSLLTKEEVQKKLSDARAKAALLPAAKEQEPEEEPAARFLSPQELAEIKYVLGE